MKRLFDFMVSLSGLLVLSPVLLACGIAIRLDSPGPVLFRQLRVGRNGRHFRIFKLRTMFVDADQRGPLVSTGSDVRITRAGRFLRRYKLDELPQLLDVLRGEMSLVGPRPEVPRYVALYPAALRDKILSVRPGITDPAAIAFIDENEMLSDASDPERCYVDEVLPAKLALYEQYVDTRSFWSDLGIIFRTLAAIGRRP